MKAGRKAARRLIWQAREPSFKILINSNLVISFIRFPSRQSRDATMGPTLTPSRPHRHSHEKSVTRADSKPGRDAVLIRHTRQSSKALKVPAFAGTTPRNHVLSKCFPTKRLQPW